MEKKESRFKHVGVITLDKKVDVSDPCYDSNVWCRTTLTNMEPGEYGCYLAYYERPEKTYVSCCRIVLESGAFAAEAAEKVMHGRSWRQVAAAIGVDAGLAGFFSDKPDFSDEEWSVLCEKMESGSTDALVVDEYDPNKYPNAFLASRKNHTELFNNSEGFWTSSGIGDGSYPVYAIRNDKRHIVALEIRFM